MKKLAALTFMSLFILSCGKQETIYLYNKYDGQDYQAALAAKQKECETENKIFEKLDLTSNFNNYFTQKSKRIFKIERKYQETTQANEAANGTMTQMIFIVMSKDTLSNGAIDINITHSNNSASDLEFLDKKIVYSQKNNKDIIATAKVGACSNKYGKTFATSYLQISDSRKVITSKEPEIYKEFSETLNFYSGYPAFMGRWNGKVTQVIQDQYNKISRVWNAPNGIKEISEADCSNDITCKKALENMTLPVCDLTIDTNHFDATQPEDLLTSFSGCR